MADRFWWFSMICFSPRSLSRNWLKPMNIDLKKLLKVGQEFRSEHEVTPVLSTNRTQKPADDIISTPGMIGKMDDQTCKYVNSFLPSNHSAITSKVVCQHKAPLSLGEHFTINGKVEDVDQRQAVFHVLCLSQSSKVIGDAKISVKVIRHE